MRYRQEAAEAAEAAKAMAKKVEEQQKEWLREVRRRREDAPRKAVVESEGDDGSRQAIDLPPLRVLSKGAAEKENQVRILWPKAWLDGYKYTHCALLACQLCLQRLNAKRIP
jgi:hypothetical protein